jgi:AcrR family transcriptional regulator
MTKESVLADRILRSTETLRLRKEALLVQMEEVLAEAMYELWPDETRRPALSTTLDAIAVAAGISRRTFFYYLKSKEDVLLAHESGDIPHVLRPTLLKQSPMQSPIDALIGAIRADYRGL